MKKKEGKGQRALCSLAKRPQVCLLPPDKAPSNDIWPQGFAPHAGSASLVIRKDAEKMKTLLYPIISLYILLYPIVSYAPKMYINQKHIALSITLSTVRFLSRTGLSRTSSTLLSLRWPQLHATERNTTLGQ